jgi:hypothetical protein
MAAGVNRHDCNQRKAGPDHDSNPVPGLEVAGVIVSVGKNVPQQRLDKRMIALTNGGAYAQFVATVAELELPMPEPAGSICACLSLQQHICLVQLRDSLFNRMPLPWHWVPSSDRQHQFYFWFRLKGAGPHVKLVWTFKFIF